MPWRCGPGALVVTLRTWTPSHGPLSGPEAVSDLSPTEERRVLGSQQKFGNSEEEGSRKEWMMEEEES